MQRLWLYAAHGTERRLNGCCFCDPSLEACGEGSKAAAPTTSSMSLKRSLKAWTAMVAALDTGLFRTEKNTPRKTSPLVATTSSSSYCRNPSHLTSDKTGRHIAQNIGRRRTRGALNCEGASALGNARLPRQKVDGFGGLGGEVGSERAASQGAPATLRRVGITTGTVTVSRIRVPEGDGPVFCRLNADETEVIQEARHAAPPQPPISMTVYARWKPANEDGATAQLVRRRHPRHGKTHYAQPSLRKEVHKQQGDHSSRAQAQARDRARVRATCHGKAKERVC